MDPQSLAVEQRLLAQVRKANKGKRKKQLNKDIARLQTKLQDSAELCAQDYVKVGQEATSLSLALAESQGRVARLEKEGRKIIEKADQTYLRQEWDSLVSGIPLRDSKGRFNKVRS